MLFLKGSWAPNRGPARVRAAAILLATVPPLAGGAGGTPAAPAAAAPSAEDEPCARLDGLRVPGAEHRQAACLTDLTTAGTVASGHTVPADWAGLHAAGTVNPSGVPGIQIDGYFPDSSTTNANHGWNHDAQFVMRLPDNWNGGLIITGSPGVRRQYANDFTIGDYVLSKGFAFASTDKGNTGAAFYTDGVRPGDALVEWNWRVTQLALAAKAVARERYGSSPRHTYVTGISNGGYLARWQAEHFPGLYDGAVDWEGTLWTEDGPNLFTFLPPTLAAYPKWAAGDAAAGAAILDAGFADGSQALWPFHYQVYWDLTQRIYREEFDPGYDGDALAGTPFCAAGSGQVGTPSACDADYDYAARPAEVHRAVGRVSLTGRIGVPMITLHGTLDSLLPISRTSDPYAQMVAAGGRADEFRYYRVAGGNHVDGLYTALPSVARPILPCYRAAFDAMVAWVEQGRPPAPSATLPRPATGDEVNSCALG
ncbi:MAG TPA: tannase/feruloyl esterase family alpha/beta hydrolase [Micromonosporaceae bacterium]